MPENARRIAGLAALVLFAAALALSAPPDSTAKAAPAAFERFKALAGEWVAAEDGEMAKKGDLVARYAVTAGGSAVVETIFPGQAQEMVTVYHADGPDLVLTHYCMEGNQPRMPRPPRARVSTSPSTAAPTSIPSVTATCIRHRWPSSGRTRSAPSGPSSPRASRCSWSSRTWCASRAEGPRPAPPGGAIIRKDPTCNICC